MRKLIQAIGLIRECWKRNSISESEGNRLVSVAGVHVYSEEYKVAAVGNIVTHPDYRGNGLGKSVTARLCQSLLEKVDHVGLNVKSDNNTAISVYKGLGFEIVGDYWEYMIEAK